MASAGRRPGPTTTAAEIVTAARTLFAQRGYQGTTLRAVADRAGVNQALIRHFYGSKQQLFLAAVAFPQQPLRDVVETLRVAPHDELGERIVTIFVRAWRDPATSHQLQAFFRAAATTDQGAVMARRLFEDVIVRQVVPLLHVEPAMLAAMLAQLLGYAFLSAIVRAEPLASAPEQDIVALLAPAVQCYLER